MTEGVDANAVSKRGEHGNLMKKPGGGTGDGGGAEEEKAGLDISLSYSGDEGGELEGRIRS